MTCTNCGADSSKTNLFCHQCGEPLTSAALKMRRDAELREKKTRELELTEAVASRFVKWAKLYAYAAGGLLLLFTLLLGKGYWDVRDAIADAKSTVNSAVTDGKSKIGDSVKQAQADIAGQRQKLMEITTQTTSLQADVSKYKEVNQHIDKLQRDLLSLQNTVVDLGQRKLKASSLQLTGPGPGVFSLGQLGCPKDKATGVISYCSEGSAAIFPAIFTAMTPDGRMRPVSSYSDRGFQDVSNASRPLCNVTTRGTIFVEKGAPHQTDSPLVCVKGSSDEYRWMRLAASSE